MMNFSSLKNVKPKQRDFFLVCIGFLFAVFLGLMWFILREILVMSSESNFINVFRNSRVKNSGAEVFPISTLSGTVVEILPSTAGKRVKVSVPTNISELGRSKGKSAPSPIPSKVFSFFLSDEKTIGSDNVTSGNRVVMHFYGEASETNCLLVKQIEVVR